MKQFLFQPLTSWHVIHLISSPRCEYGNEIISSPRCEYGNEKDTYALHDVHYQGRIIKCVHDLMKNKAGFVHTRQPVYTQFQHG